MELLDKITNLSIGKCDRCGKRRLLRKTNGIRYCTFCEGAISVYNSEPELQQKIEAIKAQLENAQTMYSQTYSQMRDAATAPIQAEIQPLIQQRAALYYEIEQLRNQIIEMNEEVLLQSFGMYRPTYNLVNSEEYKRRLDQIRNSQKNMIKSETAVTGAIGWAVNGNTSQGKKMVKDTQKLLLRAFNSDCDEVISKVKYSNLEQSRNRIAKTCEQISKLGAIMSIAITSEYHNAKIEELLLAFEYAQKKEEEKEAAKALRAQQKEDAKLKAEIESARRKLAKEQSHYSNALSQAIKQLETASDSERPSVEAKINEIKTALSDVEKAQEDIDYREANQRAGYVYVISNIGAFGENVYKIGMTRRLDPQERVDELGSASVPFKFDIHAMIFSENAPALETALHRAFENNKLNMINGRKEFFAVTLDEIKSVIHANHDKTVEFFEFPNAEQYRLSQKLRELGV